MRRERVLVLGVLGTVATGLGLATLLVPDLVRSLGPLGLFVEGVAGSNPKLLLLVTGLAVTGYVVLVARSRPASETAGTRSDAQRTFERVGSNPPEGVTAEGRTVSASAIDGSFETAAEHGGAALHGARTQLQTAAAETYAVVTGQPRDAAREAVAAGTWTDDPAAAMFLAATDDAAPPVSARVRLWLTPRRERRRRIEATVAAIERLEATA